MATPKLLLSFLLFSLLAGCKAADSSSHRHLHRHHHHQKHDLNESDCAFPFRLTKLFVFGDSYADTGNKKKSEGRSWEVPYGMTFPGYPSGRFSDGLILTDFVARFFRLKPPVPIAWWPLAVGPHLRLGTNFAYGATGVFNTLTSDPNMTVQIDYFERLIGAAVFKAVVAPTSIALVTNSGNDYFAYLQKNSNNSEALSSAGLQAFIDKVVKQLAVNLKRLYDLGVKKIAVAELPPLGCVPEITAPEFKECNFSINFLVAFHNIYLHEAVAQLNNETKSSAFVVLYLEQALYSIVDNATFPNTFKPCCMGVSSEYDCGNVDENGVKKYTVCDDPSSHLFWDTVHPTQAGWNAVYEYLKPNLAQLY